jgi:hypothetical protein
MGGGFQRAIRRQLSPLKEYAGREKRIAASHDEPRTGLRAAASRLSFAATEVRVR